MKEKEAVLMLLDCEAIHGEDNFKAQNMFVDVAGDIMSDKEARKLFLQAYNSPLYHKEKEKRAKKLKEFRDGKAEINC